uniref:Putative secreted protein n=1 Tax=Ixodes ricinus TaxID=34613 RepID=A0A6B0UII3_IXORI
MFGFFFLFFFFLIHVVKRFSYELCTFSSRQSRLVLDHLPFSRNSQAVSFGRFSSKDFITRHDFTKQCGKVKTKAPNVRFHTVAQYQKKRRSTVRDVRGAYVAS